jgi:hypothetical protein
VFLGGRGLGAGLRAGDHVAGRIVRRVLPVGNPVGDGVPALRTAPSLEAAMRNALATPHVRSCTLLPYQQPGLASKRSASPVTRAVQYRYRADWLGPFDATLQRQQQFIGKRR